MLGIHWDKTHRLTRAELAHWCGMRVADWKWADIDGWMRDILRAELERRSNGKVTLEG